MRLTRILEGLSPSTYREWHLNNVALVIYFTEHDDPHCHVNIIRNGNLYMLVGDKQNNRKLTVLSHTGDLTEEEKDRYSKCRVLIPRCRDRNLGNSKISFDELQFDFSLRGRPDLARTILEIFNKRSGGLYIWERMLGIWHARFSGNVRYDLEFIYNSRGNIISD